MEQRSEEWFQARLGNVTASRLADVIGKGVKGNYLALRAKYMDELIAERLTGQIANKFTNSAMQWGIEMEPRAREAYQMHTGAFVEEVGYVSHYAIKNAGASPDGFVGEDGLVEIKCPMTTTHLDTLVLDAPPQEYVPQIQWQLACTGRLWADFVSYDPRLPDDLAFFCKRIDRDEEYIDMLNTEVRFFLSEIDVKLALIYSRRRK